MTDRDLMQEALDALQGNWRTDESDKAIEALRARLAQPEQEPVAYVKTVIEALYENSDPVSVEAAELLEQITTLPQREWVGLTDDDFLGLTTQQIFAMKFAEAKLKEKNT